MLLTMSSSITDVSSTRVETFLRDLRSSIHLNRKMNPYTGLWRDVSNCTTMDRPLQWGCLPAARDLLFQTAGRERERKQNYQPHVTRSDRPYHKSPVTQGTPMLMLRTAGELENPGV